MKHHVKACIGRRRIEIGGEEIVVSVAGLERMGAALVSRAQPLFANRIRDIKHMQFMGGLRLVDQCTHPASVAFAIGREIENDGKTRVENGDDMRPYGAPELGRAAPVIVECLQFVASSRASVDFPAAILPQTR
jgi:hypothetical protein